MTKYPMTKECRSPNVEDPDPSGTSQQSGVSTERASFRPSIGPARSGRHDPLGKMYPPLGETSRVHEPYFSLALAQQP